MSSKEAQMNYLTSQKEASASGVEFMSASAPMLTETSTQSGSGKWPIAWTAWGLIAFCGLAWAALFSLVF